MASSAQEHLPSPKTHYPTAQALKSDYQAPTTASPTRSPHSGPQLTNLANAGLNASTTGHSRVEKSADPRPPLLTGAAALRDEEERRRNNARREQTATSPNPAMSAVNSLLGASASPMSKTTDAPTPTFNGSSSSQNDHDNHNNNNNVTSTVTVEEPMQIDTPTESSPNAQGDSYLTPGKPAKSDNKALTYPPQPPRDPIDTTPARGMSLPGSSRKSLSMKKHKCHYCDTEFTRQHNLKSHLLTHSQEKPFTCDQCNAKFRRLHDLKRHAKLHTGERPHICHKCGRRFARGDALARHSKGPGGCAGRRSSMGDDEDPDGGSNPDDSMNIDDDQRGKDEEALDYARRRSEPNNRNRDAALHPHAESGTGAFRQHSSTFPGVAAMSGGSRTASISDGRNSSTSHLSPRLGTGAGYPPGQQSLPSSSSFAHGGMTESPKPLSPSRTDSRPLGGISSLASARERSPSYSQSFSSQAHGLGASGTNSPMNLPPPTSHGPQLPSISGLGNDTRPPSITRPPPLINTHPPPPTGPLSASPAHQGSNSSSHHQSSAGSIREILNSGPADSSLLEHTRRVEAENRDLREELKGKMSDKDAVIQRLQDENRSLRAQQQHQQNSSPQAPYNAETAVPSR